MIPLFFVACGDDTGTALVLETDCDFSNGDIAAGVEALVGDFDNDADKTGGEDGDDKGDGEGEAGDKAALVVGLVAGTPCLDGGTGGARDGGTLDEPDAYNGDVADGDDETGGVGVVGPVGDPNGTPLGRLPGLAKFNGVTLPLAGVDAFFEVSSSASPLSRLVVVRR